MNKRVFKDIYRYLIYMLIVCLQWPVQYLPRCVILPAGKFCGCLCFWLLTKERERTIRQLNKALGNIDARKTAKSVFVNLGINFLELMQMPRLGSKKLDSFFKTTGLEKIDAVLSKGKGGIILTAHIGNWEYLASYVLLKGYKAKAVGRRIYYKYYNNFLDKLRRSAGVLTIDRNGSVRGMIKHLKDNGLLGILPDQDTTKVEGVFVDFFGMPAYTPTGPVNLAMVTGASIIPCFIVREGKGHHIYVEDPMELTDSGNREKDIEINTNRWSKVIEEYVRKYPDQWVWMHNRWRTKQQSVRK